MKTGMAVAVALLLLVAAGGAVLSIRDRSRAQGPIYSVTQVNAGLALHPQRWVGRTVRVRGILNGYMCFRGCAGPPQPSGTFRPGGWYRFLQDPPPPRPANTSAPFDPNTTLQVVAAPRSRLLDLVGRLPLLGRVVPSQPRAWRTVAVFTLRLQLVPCGQQIIPCYGGTLLDA